MNDRKPILEIEVSDDPTELQWSGPVTLMFDEPRKLDNTEFDTWMYGVEHDGEEKTMFAYTGLYKTINEKTPGLGAGTTINIARYGKGKKTTWFVKKLQDGAPVRQVAEAPSSAPMTSSQGQVGYSPARSGNTPFFMPLNEDERMTFKAIAASMMTLIKECVDMAKETYGDMDDDAAHRLGVSAFINADRIYKRGMTFGEASDTDTEDEQDEFVRIVGASENVLDGIINAMILVFPVDTPEDAIALLKFIGIRSDKHINQSDQKTWAFVYNVIDTFFSVAEPDKDNFEAVNFTREKFGIEEPEASPF